jgi:transcriptional regulator with XRE-family HTH domain
LAEEAGLSRAMISFIEHELRNPTIDSLLRICDSLQIEPGPLITEAKKRASKMSR